MTAARPRGRLRTFAANATYPAGPEPWAGTPTKIQPTDGAEAAGYVPETPLDPQRDNYRRWETSRWLQLLDEIEARNWTDRATVNTTPANGVTGLACATYGDRRLVLASNDRRAYASADGGYSWTTEFDLPDAASNWISLASGEDAIAGTATQGSSGDFDLWARGDGLAWNSFAGLAGASEANVTAINDARSEIVVGGIDTLGRPSVWTLTHAAGDLSAAVETVIVRTGTEPIRHLAVGSRYGLTASATATQEIGYWEPGVSAAVTPVVPFLSFGSYQVRWVVWSDEYGLFFVGLDNGTNAYVYSTDGPTTLARIATLPGVTWRNTGRSVAAVRGATIVAARGNAPDLMISTDGGVAWTTTPDPMRAFAVAPVGSPDVLVLAGTRFAAARYRAAGIVEVAQALSVGGA
jgi:hypothetical protein